MPPRFRQHDLDQTRIQRIVLDQQDLEARVTAAPGLRIRLSRHRRLMIQHFGHVYSEGNLTMVSQKSSIVFTTLMNWSRSTGLVM